MFTMMQMMMVIRETMVEVESSYENTIPALKNPSDAIISLYSRALKNVSRYGWALFWKKNTESMTPVQ